MAKVGGNPQNFIPLNKRTAEEKKAIQTAGGKASAKKQVEKAKMQEVAIAFLNVNLSSKTKEQLRDLYGFGDELLTYRALIIKELIDLIRGAERPADKMAAMKMLIDLAGETPEQIAKDKAIEKLEKAVLEDDPFTASLKTLFANNIKDNE